MAPLSPASARPAGYRAAGSEAAAVETTPHLDLDRIRTAVPRSPASLRDALDAIRRSWQRDHERQALLTAPARPRRWWPSRLAAHARSLPAAPAARPRSTGQRRYHGGADVAPRRLRTAREGAR